MAIHSTSVMGTLSHGGLVSFPRLCSEQGLTSLQLMPVKQKSYHCKKHPHAFITKDSEMTTLSALTLFCCVSRNKHCNFSE